MSLASECNRLKIQLEDLKQTQESKDNTILKIQEQIQRLFEVITFSLKFKYMTIKFQQWLGASNQINK